MQDNSNVTECVQYNGHHDKHGYPKSHGKLVSRQVLATKLGRELVKGECACHTCDNPGCINADHLWVGTMKDNTQDSIQKGRYVGGHARKVLTDGQVTEVKELLASGMSQREVARRFNVTQPTISHINTGKRYGTQGTDM